MMFRLCVALLCWMPSLTMAQRFDLDLFTGISNYQGDLQPKIFTFKNANSANAVILKYGLSDNLYLRAGFSFGTVQGDDEFNTDRLLRERNLSFQTKIQEFTAGVEYRFLKPEVSKVTPYVFLGAGFFHYDPYTYYGLKNERIYLRPLSTEGQGLAAYPGRTPYSLTQFCVPYGIGIKWQINCNLNIGAEFRQTKIFTDYLDDVSTAYVDENALRAAKGDRAIDLAWRMDEFNGSPYPAEGVRRGNPNQHDWYYFAGFTIGLKINDCQTGGFSLGGIFKGSGNYGGGGRGGGRRSNIGCPVNIW